jgi:hypothetical protein
VAVVNETFAAHYWPDAGALGKRIRLTEGDTGPIEIVGIAANHKYRGLSEAPIDFIYFPWAQDPANNTSLLVHTSGEPEATAAPLRQAVLGIDPRMPVLAVRTMDEFFRASTVMFSTVIVRIIAGMGAMGLALALIGLYGLVAYSVSRRTREIGIRVAVGANPHSVLRMVLRHGLLLALSGTAAGLLGSFAIQGALRAVFPFEDVANLDLTTRLLVVPALFVITLVAAYIPARRASRIDPLMALRQE